MGWIEEMSQRTDVTSSIRTQQIRYLNPDWTYPTRGAVLAVADNVGTVTPAMDVTLNSLGLKATTGVGELTYDGTNLLVNGEPITVTGDMSGDTIYLGTLVLTASGDYIHVKSETAEYVIRSGGGSGATGSVGPRGATGATGPTGRPGPIGATGSHGLLGPTGPAGNAGEMGATGVMGPTGSVGPRGASGLQGIAGPTGPSGLGVTGATGAVGPIGPTGFRGVAGVTGPTGPTGAMQAAGTPGTYLSPTSITTNVYGQVTNVANVGQSIPDGTYTYPTSVTTAGGYVKAISTSTNAVATVAGGSGIVVTGGTTPTATIALATAGAGAATYTSPTSLTLDAYGRVAGVSTSGATTLSSVVVTDTGLYRAPSVRWAADTSAGLYYLGPGGVAMCSSAGPVCYINQDGFNVEGGPVIATDRINHRIGVYLQGGYGDFRTLQTRQYGYDITITSTTPGPSDFPSLISSLQTSPWVYYRTNNQIVLPILYGVGWYELDYCGYLDSANFRQGSALFNVLRTNGEGYIIQRVRKIANNDAYDLTEISHTTGQAVGIGVGGIMIDAPFRFRVKYTSF